MSSSEVVSEKHQRDRDRIVKSDRTKQPSGDKPHSNRLNETTGLCDLEH